MTSLVIDHRRPLDDEELSDLKNIFFMSSSVQSFKDEESREHFYQRWLGQYLDRFPDWIWLALLNNKIVGYIVASPDSLSILNDFKIPGMELFEEHYSRFPVGLHINVDSQARGMGVGEKLISKLSEECQIRKLPGLHAITSAGDRNNHFYRKNNFLFEYEAPFKGHRLLFMGKSL
ncbi:MAG: hypothetical protein COW00_00555 [Bdellovibrio sp. CG12_big_fil_rev_8_21_14_0_65_39_13]|nr:MAG: hypothetical protein COW78_04495 [Bdellovibrio sp. CG22_combo_CG10-13_8_21_14_all_39_27]PIQ62974.1 MAG: hypothetical protein COW00_00555 [Bdellovibrio sp. CG12_big_fil_rev_8_21_14_0_65_39_13]PIR32649.1 MAG: hypothetical protein COV37_19045 [Bdellovibrio sp. CG11_big_fil_rev_8_21_14_0_20_39_38]